MKLLKEARTIVNAIIDDINLNGDVEGAWDYHIQGIHPKTYYEVVGILKGTPYSYNWKDGHIR